MGKSVGPGQGRGQACECGSHSWAGIGKGLVTYVSPEDSKWLDQQNWCAGGTPPKFYVMGAINRKMVLLHRVLLGAKKGQVVDHVNRNRMDNRRENIRFVTRSQNQINRKHKNEFRGVRKEFNQWRASIGVNRKMIRLGGFQSAIEAARAYNEAAKRLHGEFAVLNDV